MLELLYSSSDRATVSLESLKISITHAQEVSTVLLENVGFIVHTLHSVFTHAVYNEGFGFTAPMQHSRYSYFPPRDSLKETEQL